MITEKKIPIPARNEVPATQLYTKVIQKNETNVDYRPILLLVPGGPGGNHGVFNTIVDKLLKFADLILFDPRGCGYSEPSKAEYCTIYHYIDDIEAIRSYFNIKNMILLGGSYGAMAALGYAIKYPRHLSKLILLGGAPSGKFIETAKQNLEKRGTVEQKIIAEKLWNGEFKSVEEFTDFYAVMASLYSVKSSVSPPTIKPRIPYNIEVNNLGFKSFMKTFNFEEKLNKIACKVLIICGAQDWINDPQYARQIAKNIPNSELYIFDECGHFVWIDQPELFFNTIEMFF